MHSKYGRSFIYLFLYISFTVSLISCQPMLRPQKLSGNVEFPPNLDLKGDSNLPPALWFVTSNFSTAGSLGRLDLKNGDLNHSVKAVGTDCLIKEDHKSNLLLLSRTSPESLSILSGASATTQYQLIVPDGTNLQTALRDSRDLIWFTSLESNKLKAFSSDLTKLEIEVDLTILANIQTQSKNTDLSALIEDKNGNIWVSAQRMKRTSQAWIPSEESGFASLSIAMSPSLDGFKSVKVESFSFLKLVNPIDIGLQGDDFILVGGGDWSQKTKNKGSIALIELNQNNLKSISEFSGYILDSDFSMKNQPPNLIVWYPELNKSCLNIGLDVILCEEDLLMRGYVFSRVKRTRDFIFVSYSNSKLAQLWIIDIEKKTVVKKINMAQPIMSMSFGS